MKLLYVTEDRYPPYRADVVELFAKQMPSRGHQIDWLMQQGEIEGGQFQDDREVTWLGNTVFLAGRERSRGFLGRVINNLSSALGDLRVFKLAQKNRYDVIQVRDKFLASLYVIAAAKLTGAKFVYWMSYPFPESKISIAKNRQTKYPLMLLVKGYALKILLYGVILPKADFIFVQSEQMKKDVAAEGIPLEKMQAVPMGIKSEKVSEKKLSDCKQLNTEQPTLLYLGIILRLRHSEMLVRVLEKVKQKYPGAKLIYVGEGQNHEDRLAIEAESKRLGLERDVTITGFLPMEKAWEYVEAADICFSPFYPIPVLLSTSPTKLIEYMAMAKVIVANEHPEQTQIMNDSGVGVTVEWGEQAFADEVCRLLNDPSSAVTNANKGPAWVKSNRTYEVIADKVHAKYLEILGK